MVDFTIVTISFNQAQFLEQCIKSILAQTGPSFEYNVVDPGSTDASRSIINEYSDRINRLVLEPDTGPAEGLNNGFRDANGRYLLFINADDFLLPGALQKISSRLALHGNPDVLLCAGWLVNARGIPLRRLYSSRFTREGLVNNAASLFQQGMVIRCDAYRKLAGFNESNKTCWDFELLVDLVKLGVRTRVDTTTVAAFRLHEESISGRSTGSVKSEAFANDLERVHFKMLGLSKRRILQSIGWLTRIEKYLLTPEIVPHILHDRCLKSRVADVWTRDNR